MMVSNTLLIGISRQFAFAQFIAVRDARRFLENNYPNVSLYGPYDSSNAKDAEATKVRIAYSRERDDRDKPGKNEDDWKCEIVSFRCLQIIAESQTDSDSATLQTMTIEISASDAMQQGHVSRNFHNLWTIVD
jgi:hypothetical protein